MPQPDYQLIAQIAGGQLMTLRRYMSIALRYYRVKRSLAGDRVVLWSAELDAAREDDDANRIGVASQRMEDWMMIAKQWAQAIQIMRLQLKHARQR